MKKERRGAFIQKENLSKDMEKQIEEEEEKEGKEGNEKKVKMRVHRVRTAE